jgi:hypothetical protein
MKHKVIQDYQFVTTDKKIIILKSGITLENYTYSIKGKDSIHIDKDIIDNNISFFKPIDWKEELNIFLKQNKIPQPAIITKKIIPFIEEMFILNSNQSSIKSQSFELEEIEIENKSKKIAILESKLREDMDNLNLKEIELSRKESKLNSLKLEIENDLKNQEIYNQNYQSKIEELQQREDILNKKDSQLGSLISKDELNSKISKIIDEVNQSGSHLSPQMLESYLKRI